MFMKNHGIREILSKYAIRNSAKFRGILGNFARNTEETGVQKTYGISCRRNSVDTLPALSKKVNDFPVPSRDVDNQTLPGQE